VHQFTILVSSALLTKGTKYGIGLHFEDVDLKNISTYAWISISAGFCTILGTTWSKTSFAITLLRLSSSRWMRGIIWLIIISVNLVLGFAATVMWIQCWPVAKLANSDLPGSCWPAHVVQNYMTFASGTYLAIANITCTRLANINDSLFRRARYSALPPSMADCLECYNQQKGEDRRGGCHEYGRVVCLTVPPLSALSYQFSCSSSGIMSFLKIIGLDDITDYSCKSSFIPSLTPRLNLT
jgi:hypothetical protein